MPDEELVRFSEAAGYMCSPKANLNKPAAPIFVLQLDEAQAEWRRRNPRPSASSTEIPPNFGPKLETDTGKNGVAGS